MKFGLGRQFPTTLWSLVMRAGHSDGPVRRDALGRLAGMYAEPLRRHLIGRGLKRQDADDLVQGFLTDKVVEANLLKQADRGRGKFRTFLLTALNHYASNQMQSAKAQKRGGGRVMQLTPDVDGVQPAARCRFEMAWARQVLGQAVRQTRRECLREGRDEVWHVFKTRLLRPSLSGVEPISYQQLVERYRLRTPAQASNLLITGKRMFTRNIYQVLGQYVPQGSSVDMELADLQEILSA